MLESLSIEDEQLSIAAIDLLVALIKDLGGDLYEVFIKEMMPAMIKLIDI